MTRTKKIAGASLGALTIALVAGACALLGFAGTTFAATGAEVAGESLFDLARPLIDAVMGGNYFLAAVFALVIAVTAVRKYGSQLNWLAWTKSDWGTPLLVLLGSFGTAFAATIGAGQMPGWGAARAAFGVAVAAAGGWKLAKELAVPVLEKLGARWPWATPLLKLLLWAFDRPDPVAEAEAAGDAAVEADPPSGLEGITGKPVEFK